MLAGETLLRPTRRYTITYRSGRRVDVDAEGIEWRELRDTRREHCHLVPGTWVDCTRLKP